MASAKRDVEVVASPIIAASRPEPSAPSLISQPARAGGRG